MVLSGGDYWSRGARFPETLLLEAMAQATALALQDGGPRAAALAGVEDVKFFRPVEAGMQLRIEAQHLASLGPVAKLRSRAFLGEEEMASAVLLVAG